MPITYPTPIDLIVSEYPDLFPMENEDVIDLTRVPVDLSTGETQVSQCDDYLRLNGNQINQLLDNLASDYLIELFNEATALKDASMNGLTAVKVILGVTIQGNVQKLLAIFQPLYLQRTRQSGTEGSYTPIGGKFYIHENNEVTEIPGRDASTWSNNYVENIQFISPSPSTPPPPSSIINSLVILFQTIFTSLCQNQGSDEMNFYNAILTQRGVISQYLLLLPNVLGTGAYLSSVYANRSHLCPPDCTLYKFEVVDFK